MSAGKHDCVYRSSETNFAKICIFLWVCNLWVFSLWFCSRRLLRNFLFLNFTVTI